jgi:uncharacterized protein DUF6804
VQSRNRFLLFSKVPASAFIVILLFATFGRWPYGFYTLLRLVVCVTAIYLAVQAKKLSEPIWMWLMVGTALLFNPIVPVTLTRSDWQPVDLIAAAAFAISLLKVRQRGAEQESRPEDNLAAIEVARRVLQSEMLAAQNDKPDAFTREEQEILDNLTWEAMSSREDGIQAQEIEALQVSEKADEQIQTSWKRIMGAATFAFLAAGYLLNAARFTIPALFAVTSGVSIDPETAQSKYDTFALGLLPFGFLIITAFAGAMTAGFLARRRGILAGLLANGFYIPFLAYATFSTFAGRETYFIAQLPDVLPPQIQVLFGLLFLLVAACIGGLLGERFYSPKIDFDRGQDRVTIFGIRWQHYLWILPLVFYPFLASAIMILFAWARVLWADFSYAWHPSLWFSSTSWLLVAIGPALLWGSVYIAAGGLIRFFSAMRYGRNPLNFWQKFGRAVLYGIGAPALSYTLAALSVDAARALPRPASGDWKIAVVVTAIIASIVSYLKARTSTLSIE